ncbi:hypothetical protein LTR84_010681 [Exophiala bonariae]|uniref:Major facilitator superfamily (MFS) profile domain-containing protein n=1 Tax=Exophiala bonariae TaxID=1690606 RepID=A0AAV9MT47_9EURO|nr:hypothetical protein LTR84_010681 [Exophiala bonariae]
MGLVDASFKPVSNADSIIGAMSGVFQAGAVINVFGTAWLADRYGRKSALHWCSFLSLIGGALLCASTSSTMFIVARLFAGAGAWGTLAVVPIYTAELAPPRLRGLMVGLNGVNIAIGYALATWMGLAFYYVDSPAAQWRAPLGISLVWPLVMIGVCFIVPESPRFLLMKGRVEEARHIVLKLHSIKGDTRQEFARSEFYQMVKQAEVDRQITPGWVELFRNPSYRKRVFMAAAYACFVAQVDVQLGPTIYAALGYGTEKQLILQSGWVAVGIVANLLGAVIMDHVGRKPLLLLGLGGCCVCLIIEAAMVSSFAEAGTNKAGLQMGVAATYLFLFIYSLGVDVAGIVFYSEIFSNHLRARGLAFTIAALGLTDLLFLQVAATAFRHIGWKFYLVFIILSAIGTVWVWVAIPETKGVPLEEVARIFGDNVAVYEADVHVDHEANELVVDQHGASDSEHITRVATEAGVPGYPTGFFDGEKRVGGSEMRSEHLDDVRKY